MPTTREVTAARAGRLAREARFYTPDLLDRVCADTKCALKLPAVLVEAGEHTHATCTPEARRLLKRDRPHLVKPLGYGELLALVNAQQTTQEAPA